MASGPKPIPKKILEQRGSYRTNPARRPDCVDIDPKHPIPPYELDPDVHDEWERLVSMLGAMGILGEVDAYNIARYCETWVMYLRCLSATKEGGAVVETSRGVTMNPWAKLLDQTSGRLNQLGASLGMSPADRVRIPKPEKKEEKSTLKLRIS